MRIVLSILCIVFSVSAAIAQDTEKDKIRELENQREFAKNRQTTAHLDSAKELMDRGEYELADEHLRYVLANMKSVPSDVVYHFGKNSYHLQKYRQSVDWLTKYIQLKGTTGQYSQDAAFWLKLAEEELVKQRLAETAKATQVLSKDFTIDCGPSGKVVCPVCNGSTVVIKKGYFGDNYSTCKYCKKLGYLSCDEYNKLLKGQLKTDL